MAAHRFIVRRVRPLVALSLALGGCSVKKMAVKALADELSSGSASTSSTDEDLELVGEAIPFALKLMESLEASAPEHEGLKLALASGFTQYSVVYVQFPASQARYRDYDAWQAGTARARRLQLRARRYALAGMDLRHAGFSERVIDDPAAALADTNADDVPLLYWLGASWMAAISNSPEDPELIGQLPSAAAVLRRALELDPDWDRGAIHEVLISVEPALPLPGGADRAREHFTRAVTLSEGKRASPYVSLATAVAVPAQDRAEFVSLLEKALEVDVEASPDDRLANEYAQRQARFLLAHTDDLFLEDLP